MHNILELNDLIYAGAKLVSNKTDIFVKNTNRNTKARWEMMLKGQIFKKMQEQAKTPK